MCLIRKYIFFKKNINDFLLLEIYTWITLECQKEILPFHGNVLEVLIRHYDKAIKINRGEMYKINQHTRVGNPVFWWIKRKIQSMQINKWIIYII